MHCACIKINVNIKDSPLVFNLYFFRVDSLNPPLDCVHLFYLEKCIGSFKSTFGLLQWFYRIFVVGVLYRIRSVIFGPYISRTVSPNNLGLTYSEVPD